MTADATGKVYLVGAGPGDPKLLTLRGLECLQQADVVVYDRLVSKRLLRYARQDAKRIYVGKAPGQHLFTQDEINELLATEAKAGQVVCRLKGGDPFVFGRGGEEAAFLAAEGVTFEMVPGVTSAIAAPAYAGMPVTDRRLASVVSFVTGHEDTDKPESTIRWESLAKGSDTFVFLMGMKALPQIVEKLLAAGRSPETPVAVIQWGTTARQRTVVGQLKDIEETVAQAGLTAPAVTVVGDVVNLREHIAWFEKKPLFGQRILVTRTREQASELVALIEELGGEALEFPTIRIQPLPADKEKLRQLLEKSYNWIVFTSPNGIECLLKQLGEIGRDIRALEQARLAAIGPGTAESLRARGLKVNFVPSRFVAEAIVEEFPEPVQSLCILIPRARVARDTMQELLKARGAEVDILPVYETLPDTSDAAEVRTQLSAGEINIITFTSSSTVENFLKLIDLELLSGVRIACIGPITASTAQARGLTVDIVAEEHTIEGLVAAIQATRSTKEKKQTKSANKRSSKKQVERLQKENNLQRLDEFLEQYPGYAKPGQVLGPRMRKLARRLSPEEWKKLEHVFDGKKPLSETIIEDRR